MDNELFKDDDAPLETNTDKDIENNDSAISTSDDITDTSTLSTQEIEAEVGEKTPEGAIDYAQLEKDDIAALRGEFTEVIYMKSLSELKNPERYGELRDMGLSPKEAYLASGGKRQKQDNRTHLHSAVPRSASGQRSMPEEDLRAAKNIFDGMSDGEIIRLYRKVNSQQ